MPVVRSTSWGGMPLAFVRCVRCLVPALLLFLSPLAPASALARDAAPGARASASPPASGPAQAREVAWQPDLAGARSLSAVAFDRSSGQIAFGDARGVVLFEARGAPLATSIRPDVTALLFGAAGTLRVGTAQGLFVREGDGDLRDDSPAPGDEARSIVRLAGCGDVTAIATAGGVYVAREGRRWEPMPGVLGRAAASAVALGCRSGGIELRAVAAGELWRATLAPGETVPVSGSVTAVEGLDPGIRARAVDVLLEEDGTEVVLAGDRLALRGPGEERWRILRPTLVPGAIPLRVAAAAGRLWLGTDRGLFAEETDGAWTRQPPDGATAAIRDVAGGPEAVLAATELGLIVGRLGGKATPQAAARRAALLALEFPGRHEPAVGEIFAAALDHLALRPETMRDLRRGLAVRGLLPTLELRLERGRAYEGDLDYDESFVSGDLRRLRDQHQGSQRAVTALLELSWDLGDLAFSPDAIDVSKEARAVLQLRDDVLDEITHLFFERRRVLLELAALDPAAEAPTAERLRLRADELAAGLDAWTGGWFGRHVPPLAP